MYAVSILWGDARAQYRESDKFETSEEIDTVDIQRETESAVAICPKVTMMLRVRKVYNRN